MPHLVKAFLALFVLAALTGCTTTYPVVGSFEDYNEVFTGTVNSDLMTGTSFIEVRGQNSKMRCAGGSSVRFVPASNYIAGAFLIPYCAGQKGEARNELPRSKLRGIKPQYRTKSARQAAGNQPCIEINPV
jgi:hypothetical protein